MAEGEPMPLLIDGARSLGFELSERQVERFQRYYRTLVDWNSRINLTAITDPEGVQTRHFLDSLSIGSVLLDLLTEGNTRPDAPPAIRLIDIGTGAGFPGVPLKILWPHIRLALADSVGKKTTFLEALLKELGIVGVPVVTARAEELGQAKEHRGKYDVVTARAVASLPVLCEYCIPLLKVGGWMLAPKKGDISQELKEAKEATRLLGGGPPMSRPVALPGEDETRVVVAIRKVRPTLPGYPRRVGLAKTRPLGQ